MDMPIVSRPRASGGALSMLALSLFLLAATLPLSVRAEPEGDVKPADLMSVKAYSPYAYQDFPNQLLFGDMHLHTNLSPDAGLLGTQLTAENAYRAARGETVRSNTGQPFRLVRPLISLWSRTMRK